MAEPYSIVNRGSQIVFDNSSDDVVTDQAALREADVNEIVRRYDVSVYLDGPNANYINAAFGTGITGQPYSDLMNLVVAAREAFEGMPADLKNRFHHDPQELLEFLQDAGNQAEAVELGIVPEGTVLPVAGL